MNFKKRVNGSWTDTPHYIHNTSTDAITTPADIYANGNNATVGISGNTVQDGTPTPDNPIMPEGTGDLETVGAKAGQYKIPISSANTTTPVYLGEVETTRKIKKLVLDGANDGEWKKSSTRTGSFYLDVGANALVALGLCDRAINVDTVQQYNSIGKMFIEPKGLSELRLINLWLFDTNISLDDFKAYLAQQYAAGTPVTVWYVLAEPETGIVNEPLRKIGTYADEVSGITIPTIAGANTLSVDTTLQPSEVTVNYKGWHPVQSVHEYDSNYTIATMQALTIAQLQTHTISELQGGEWS